MCIIVCETIKHRKGNERHSGVGKKGREVII